MIELYLLNEREDRDYFVDGYRVNPVGLCERFDITLRERPNIPTAKMRYDVDTIHGVAGDYALEDNYENVEITLSFNYISQGNGRQTYNAVSNYLSALEPGTRLRFSDDKDNIYRELARRPIIEELNNDLYNWGDFEVVLVLRPFRYVEQKEIYTTMNNEIRLEQPLPNAIKIPQKITHQVESGVVIELFKNGKKIYEIADANTKKVIADAELLYTYGGD